MKFETTFDAPNKKTIAPIQRLWNDAQTFGKTTDIIAHFKRDLIASAGMLTTPADRITKRWIKAVQEGEVPFPELAGHPTGIEPALTRHANDSVDSAGQKLETKPTEAEAESNADAIELPDEDSINQAIEGIKAFYLKREMQDAEARAKTKTASALRRMADLLESGR